MDYLGVIILLLIFIGCSILIGKYLYKIIFNKKSVIDRFFDPIDNFIYKLCKIKGRDMNWKQYVLALLITNGVLFVSGIGILVLEKLIRGEGLSLDGIFNIGASFITNTNLQTYGGETALTNISQMTVIIMFMFTSSATGFAVAGAFIRGITGHGMGNFYRDLTRIITRYLLPLSFIFAIFFISQGVPQTLDSAKTVETIEGGIQTITYGPVAALESIKHLGTNGGGFFSANSAYPFENPTALTNVVEMLLMMVSSGAYIFVFGQATKNKKRGYVVFAVAFILLAVSLFTLIEAEKIGNPVLNQIGIENTLGNMEGKEMRFGAVDSALFSGITTSFTTGSVNNMHDSLTPLGTLVTLFNMMLNSIFGGKGIGFLNILIYGLLGIFICGLMVGKTPEFLRKKLEGREMKLIAGVILIHPILILLPTAIAVIFSGGSIEGYHDLTRILYEFTSSAANNGSALEGLMDVNLFYNLLTGVVMILGRYIPIVLCLGLAGGLSKKEYVSEDSVSFRTDGLLFFWILLATILIIGALTFLPVLILGPGAEILTM